MSGVYEGSYIGKEIVDGVLTEHLAFRSEEGDWQIWIEDGAQPVPRRLVISYKTEPGSPQYTATLSDWDFQPRIADHYFEFIPPPGSDEIEFLENFGKEVRP